MWIDGIQRDRVDHRDVDRIEGEEALFTAIDHHFINHGVERELIEEHAHLFIGGARPEFVGGNDSLTVGRALNEEVGSYSVAATAPDGWIHKVGGTRSSSRPARRSQSKRAADRSSTSPAGVSSSLARTCGSTIPVLRAI